MQCSRCGYNSPAGLSFCGKCGAQLLPLQISKDRPLPKPSSAPTSLPDEMPVISRDLSPQISGKILPTHGVPTNGARESERRHVTALFVDIKGYTPLSEQLGEEAVYHLMEKLYEIMITAVQREEGNVQKLTGDGIFALFGAPIALEDAPYRACRAALEIQTRLKAFGDELEKERGIRPMARIGIHTGPVVVGTVGTDRGMEFTALGDTINLASRLESIADPGTVYISDSVYALAGPYIESSFLGERQVKGKTALQKVYRVEGIKQHTARFDVSMQKGLTPLAGRTKELTELEQYLNQANSGRTTLVQIIGEPGVGKSRLLYELHNRIRNKHIFYIRATCMSFGRTTSFLPFIAIVKDLLRINDKDDEQAVDRKIVQGLELDGMDLRARSLILNLLGFRLADSALQGLDAKLIGDQTRDVIKEFLRKRSRIAPMILAIEDLHWMDPASEDLIAKILAEEDHLQLLIACTTRPSYSAPWTGSMAVKEIRLAPLAEENAVQMVKEILGSEHVDEEISRMIIEKAGCNPLFTEEMIRYLLDTGSLKRTDRDVFYEFAVANVHVPATILDLLQTRIDRLSEEQRMILQVASVIGQRFSPVLAARVAGIGEAFEQNLSHLAHLELIFLEPVGHAVEYRFKHALLQDVVYDGLLKPRRKELHHAVAAAIESLYPDRLRDWAELLAHHWDHAGRTGKALRYIALSGEKSLQVYALEEAHQRFKQAIGIFTTFRAAADDAFWSDIILSWAHVFYYKTDYKGMINALERYVPFIAGTGDKRRLSLLLFWLGGAHSLGGRSAKAKEQLEKAKALGDELGEAECIGLASSGLMWIYSYWTPDAKQSDAMVQHFFEQAERQIDENAAPFLLQSVYFCIAVHEMMRQRYKESRAYCQKLLDFGRRKHDDRCIASALAGFAFCCNFEERFEEALRYANQSLRLSPDYFSRILARVAKAAAFALSGNIRESLEMLTAAESECADNDFLYILGAVLIPLGAVMVLNGQMAKGVAKIKNAMKYWASLGNYTQPVWGNLILGEVYYRMAEGKERPSLKAVFRNFRFILLNVPLAHQKARRHLEDVVSKSREYNMPGFLAKALYRLGLLARTKKRITEARRYWEEALRVSESNGLHLAEKIRVDLQTLIQDRKDQVRAKTGMIQK